MPDTVITHPLYQNRMADWQIMRDTYAGERAIKDAGFKYLPATSGMEEDGVTSANSPGYRAYSAYKKRARFPEIVEDAVQAMIGVMHHKSPTIELPEAMEPSLENATLRGESMEMLLRRINEQQLITGRVGLLLDMPRIPVVGQVLPYITVYPTEAILNWDDTDEHQSGNLSMALLDESEYSRKGLSWQLATKYRILLLGDSLAADGTVYSAGVSANTPDAAGIDLVTPVFRGRTLNMIPFVIVNSKDVVIDPDKPPLLGLASLALTMYRGEADYRQSLFMQGQDTLVVVGAQEGENFRTGANASIVLPVGGDAKFIGVDSAGISEQREALQNDTAQATQRGGQMLDSVSRVRESGEALKIRVSARTATLNQIALAGAFGLEQLLKIEAVWIGADPDAVRVEPNLDFVDDTLVGKDLVDYLTAKNLGAPYSMKSIHKQMQDKGLTELSYEEELAAIDEEPPLGGASFEGEPDAENSE